MYICLFIYLFCIVIYAFICLYLCCYIYAVGAAHLHHQHANNQKSNIIYDVNVQCNIYIYIYIYIVYYIQIYRQYLYIIYLSMSCCGVFGIVWDRQHFFVLQISNFDQQRSFHRKTARRSFIQILPVYIHPTNPKP